MDCKTVYEKSFQQGVYLFKGVEEKPLGRKYQARFPIVFFHVQTTVEFVFLIAKFFTWFSIVDIYKSKHHLIEYSFDNLTFPLGFKSIEISSLFT
jgi:hypothetical protein